MYEEAWRAVLEQRVQLGALKKGFALDWGLVEPGGRVTLRIYDVAGRLVRTLVNNMQTAGEKRVSWDARNDHGSRVATGVDFYRMSAPGFETTKKMVLLQ